MIFSKTIKSLYLEKSIDPTLILLIVFQRFTSSIRLPLALHIAYCYEYFDNFIQSMYEKRNVGKIIAKYQSQSTIFTREKNKAFPFFYSIKISRHLAVFRHFFYAMKFFLFLFNNLLLASFLLPIIIHKIYFVIAYEQDQWK